MPRVRQRRRAARGNARSFGAASAAVAAPARSPVSSADAVSDDVIRTLVQTLLADQGVNVALLPDAIERRLYEQAARSALGALHHATQTFRLELLGHELRLVMRPIGEQGARRRRRVRPTQ